MKIGCSSDLYTTFGDSYLSTISNKLSLNPCNFNCCHWPWSQLYPPSKFCKILQHTDNSVPCGHHSHAQTRGIKTYRRWSHMQGRSWSTQFPVFLMPGPGSWLVIQPCQYLEFFRCVWFTSRCIGLNQVPILASIADLDTSANIRDLGARRIPLVQCTCHFINHNNERASTILIWTADMSSGLFPGTPRIASPSTACYFVALFSRYSVNLRSFFYRYILLSTFPNFTSSNMESTASQVRNHYSRKNQ